MDPGLRALVSRSIADFCNSSQRDASCLLAEPVYAADRRIYRVQLTPGNRYFALKVRGGAVHKESDLADQATADEYRKMEAAWSMAARAPDVPAMPVPVAFFADHRAILTTWCEGVELRRRYYRRVWSWPVFAEQLRAYFRSCGAWLGRFHAASRKIEAPGSTVDNRLRHVDRILDQVARSPRNLLGSDQMETIRREIAARLRASGEISTGLLHGNFTLRNLLVSPAGAVPVDFEDSRTDAVHMDTGQFVADVLLSAYRPLIRQHPRRQLIGEFLDGYADHGELDEERISGFALYHVLATYYEVLGRVPSGAVGRMLARRQLAVYSRILESMVRQPRNALG